MTHTSYQVYHQAPGSSKWTRYTTIPSTDCYADAQALLDQHQAGTYKGHQYKPWLRNHTFCVAYVETRTTLLPTQPDSEGE